MMSDEDFDHFSGLVDVEHLYLKTTIMYRCPRSDHLWCFWHGPDHPPALYEPVPLPPGWT